MLKELPIRLAGSLSLEYITQLVLTKEEAGEIEVVVLIGNIIVRNTSTMERKLWGSNTTYDTLTDKNRIFTDATDRKMLSTYLQSLMKRYSIKLGGRELLKDNCIDKICKCGEGQDA